MISKFVKNQWSYWIQQLSTSLTWLKYGRLSFSLPFYILSSGFVETDV